MTSDHAPIYLAALGDPSDMRTWGGTPYHFMQACRRAGLPMIGVKTALSEAGISWRRGYWAASQILRLRRARGFQYSHAFLDAMWGGSVAEMSGVRLLNFFQLYPQSLLGRSDLSLNFFLDQTLRQLFEYYGTGANLSPKYRDDIIGRERAQYRAADLIITRNSWAARSLVTDYDVPRSRVRVVVAGANLDADAVSAWEKARPSPCVKVEGDPLRLVFVGREWERKGLDRLIRAHAIALAKGRDIELTIIGVLPQELPPRLRATRKVNWLGVIDKRTRMREFIDAVSSCDVGCLLSRAEAGGISLREFVRLGLPTFAPDTGGSPEFVVRASSTLFPGSASDEEIAEKIGALSVVLEKLERQKRIAWAERATADWSVAARQFAGWFGSSAGRAV